MREIEAYTHDDKKRMNNPPVGIAEYDVDEGKKRTYSFDPHLDPELQWNANTKLEKLLDDALASGDPETMKAALQEIKRMNQPHLLWAGKAEGLSFEVPTTSIHIHESIKPHKIIASVLKKYSNALDGQIEGQQSMFEAETPAERMRRKREAIEFYQHGVNWTNRLIAGDSLVVMNSLLEKEGMAGQVQMVYIDPPYGIKYGSNFQPFVNKRDVRDRKDEDLTQEPEMVKAFRDTWELGIHSYLTYLRNRLLLVRELLHESGSVFVQISDENVHHVREVMDEIFGNENFIAIIAFKTATNQNANRIQRLYDYLVWYGKTKEPKFKPLYRVRTIEEIERTFNYIEPETGRRYKAAELSNYTPEQLNLLRKAGRLVETEKYGKRYPEDFEYTELENVWWGTIISTFSKEKVYAVQTSTEAVGRAVLMTTDPGDLVLDITCGSGTTAYVAEQWGRRWITCDTSRVAIALAKQRLMTATFDYYKLAHPEQGVAGGFVYKTVPHITLKSIANGEPPEQETLYDQPEIDRTKIRISGPFTVEALPAPVVRPIDEASLLEEDYSAKQDDWRGELLATGILGRNGAKIEFSRVEPLSGTKFLHAEAETKEDPPRRAVICFGSETKPMDSRMVALALDEAQELRPSPKLIIFAAFQFDPEAAKDIDEVKWPGVTLLKVQMNTDLMTEDLKKKRSSNQSFWLVGQPDVELIRIEKGRDKGKYMVRVNGFDYYDVKKGEVVSGGPDRIAMWMLDTNYDGMCIEPAQVFFPMGGRDGGWSRLARTLKAEIDPDLIERYAGNESLPFTVEPNTQIAVKIIDDRGIESLKVIKVGDR